MSRERRQEIVAAAARIFNEQGFHRTSMADVAQAVGMLKGSLYYYFESKDQLLFEVIQTPLQKLVEALEAVLEQEVDPGTGVREAIRRHIESSAEYYPHLFVIAQERFDFLGEPYRSRIMALHRRYRALWLQLLRRGAQAGRFRSDLDPSLVAFAILGMCNWMYRWYRPEGRASPRVIAEHFAEVVLSGLRAPGAGAPGASQASLPGSQ
ncbi:MAG: TetR family transcriptional regulator [Limnochordaceae bacterium]|nr:TetR family transcriptional regulator [Limnochordaceae bacterium]